MRLLIVGVGVWPERLGEALLQLPPPDGVPLEITVAGPGALLQWSLGRRRGRVDVAVRVGLRPGALTKRGLAFDLLWWAARARHRWRSEVFYWIGTDVLKAQAQRGWLARRRLTSAVRIGTHVAAAPWLCEELAALGVPAELAYFPLVMRDAEVEPLPAGPTLRLLSYAPKDRWEFYGGDLMLEALSAMGDGATMTLVGGRPSSVTELPPNVQVLDHVDDFPSLIPGAHAVLRIVEHDALGATVVEALQLQRHVVYTYPLAGARHVRFGDVEGLVDELQDLARLLAAGELPLNGGASSWLDHRTYDGDARVILQAVVNSLRRDRAVHE